MSVVLGSGLLPTQALADPKKDVSAPSQSKLAPVKPMKVATPAAGKGTAAAEPLTLKGFVDLIYGSDETILVQRLEEEIARQKVKGAEAVYEPFFNSTASYDSSYILNTANEILQRANQAEYRSRVGQVNNAIGVKVPTGADVEVSYNVARIRNSLQSTVGSISPEYKAYLGLKLTQPLLRGAGPDATNSSIRIAEYEREMAREAVRQVEAQRLVEGITVYFNVQRAQQRVRLRTQALEISRRLMQEMRSQERNGLRSAGEALDVEATTSQRQAQLEQAQQELEEQINELQARVSARAREQGRGLRPRHYTAADRLALQATRVPLPDGIAAGADMPENGPNALPPVFTDGLANRPESKVIKNRIAREKTDVEYAENQALPELNVVARYGIEDLNTEARYRPVNQYFGASSIPYNSWTVGLTFKMGLYGDDKKKSDLNAAKTRHQQAELAQMALQQRIVNEIVSSATVLDRILDVVDRQTATLNAQRQLVAMDEGLVRQGRKSSVDLMKRQLDALAAEEALSDSVVLANRASLIASQAQGKLLSRFDLE
ncbi:TolC family protein [Azospirillum sp. sgz302134]